MSEAAVRRAFDDQARVCAGLGSPFTARICELMAARLDRSYVVGQRVLDWPGQPDAHGDALPLRLCGALHALARQGRVEAVTAAWPPSPQPDDDRLWTAIQLAFRHEAPFVLDWIKGPPQTNEVGRSAALMTGLLVLADRYGLSFELYELGSSAGLNLNLDRYAFNLGGVAAGDSASPVKLVPEWIGTPPPGAAVRIAGRQGVDVDPLPTSDSTTGERLMAYVWADQRDRVQRLQAALMIAQAAPPSVARSDAAAWLERVLDPNPAAGICRVVMHTIAYQYFSADSQARVRAQLDRVGARATAEAPLAWLTYEGGKPVGADGRRWAELSLTTWPGGQTQVLARGHPHGGLIEMRATL